MLLVLGVGELKLLRVMGYWLARAVVMLLQALPLVWVAQLGRFFGWLAFLLDGRHRRRAEANLQMVFGHELAPGEIRSIARENFKRLGENYCSAVKTAAMPLEKVEEYCEFVGVRKPSLPQERVAVAIGHFGNFELYARFAQLRPDFAMATTYRGLRQPGLNRLMQELRAGSGCRFFERRTEWRALLEFMKEPRVMVGFLADQHAGRSGVVVPFLGHRASTTTAPAVFAQRYECSLITAVCFRVGLGRWRIEAGEEIPLTREGVKRPVEEVMADVNDALGRAVRRDPANWFWVHDRWKADRKIRAKGQANAG